MSASGSSFQHPSLYGLTKTPNSPHLSPLPPSSTSSYSPLRRLQRLTTTISSRPQPARSGRGPGRQREGGAEWEWEGRDDEKDSNQENAVDGDGSSRENGSIGGDDPLAHKQSMAGRASRDQSDSSDSGPPSPAFSLNSNSPFANGLLHFESSLFEDDDVNQDNDGGGGDGFDEGHEVKERERSPDTTEDQGRPNKMAVLESNPRVSCSNSTVAPEALKPAVPLGKVVTRSQRSGQRRRYWEESESEWESDSEFFGFGSTTVENPMASCCFNLL